MQIIIGLGNPGDQYKLTRHNAGFLALDHIANSGEAELLSQTDKFRAHIKELRILGKKTLLFYPQTFMNDSGEAVHEALNFYKLGPADILVLHDEVDLPLGTFKFTASSGSAGHNGIKSLIAHLGTQDFRRIRIGVDSRVSKDTPPTDTFVLQKFADGEVEKIPFGDITHRVIQELTARDN